MRGLRVAGEGGVDGFVRVERDVEDEAQPCLPGGEEHVPVDGVAVQDAGSCAGVGDEPAAMVGADRQGPRDAGQHALAPAGEPGEEMGFDEPLGQKQVGVEREGVEPERAAGGQGAEMTELRGVLAVVHDEAFGGDEGVAELAPHFIGRRGAMAAGGDEEGDVDRGVAPPEAFEEAGKGDPARNGPRVVAGDDRGGAAARGERFERGRADGMVESRLDAADLLGFVGLVGLRGGGTQNGPQAGVRDVGLDMAVVAGQADEAHRRFGSW